MTLKRLYQNCQRHVSLAFFVDCHDKELLIWHFYTWLKYLHLPIRGQIILQASPKEGDHLRRKHDTLMMNYWILHI